MKIVYCIPSLYTHGGMEKTLTLKANHLNQVYKHDITIITTDGKERNNAFSLDKDIKVINLDINFDHLWKYGIIKQSMLYLLKQIKYKKKLTSLLHTLKPDITISMLRREINFLHKIKDGSIKLGEIHLNRDNFRDFNESGFMAPIKKILSRIWIAQLIKSLKKLDKFVVLSYEDQKKWREIANTKVIYNALPKIPSHTSTCKNHKIIAAGRFVPQKGFDLLIKSWSLICEQYSDWELHIYGTGNKNEYLRLIENNQAINCFLHDAVTDINSKFEESSVFAFSSRFEGFGMVITEAMSCGLPVVAFACPCGPKDIITDKLNGLLCEPGNIREFSDNLAYLMNNQSIRIDMGNNAKARAKDFTIDTIGKEWNDLFTKLYNKKVKSS